MVSSSRNTASSQQQQQRRQGRARASQRAAAPPSSTQPSQQRQRGGSKGKERARASFDEDDEDDEQRVEEEDDDDDDVDVDIDHLPPPLRGSSVSQSTSRAAQENGRSAAEPTNAGVNGGDNDDDEEPGLVNPTPTIQAEELVEEDCIRILLATDNHIGYNERDPVRGRDSIETFREILELAKRHEVDMLLLAGDLFHENKPSRASLHQTIALLREYCMGDRPISLEIVSDAGVGIQTGYDFPSINYDDPNLNIEIPVFSIHGNHDDPQGAGPEGALCALDILSASGLVNYFGRQELPGDATTDEEARESGIQVKPILLRKGETKLAMFGIGNIRDERFHAEMRKNRISMFRPAEDPDSWFNLLLIHQNRVPHGPKSSVPENGFGDEVDLIVWGHEHDCRIDPEPVTGKGYYIVQPGSSVATSLGMGEAQPKHVALLSIQRKGFRLDKLRLKTVRPFVMDDLSLDEISEIEGRSFENKTKVNQYLKTRVEELIQRAKDEWEEIWEDEEERDEDGKPLWKPDKMPLPLVRLRVEYNQHEVGNPQRFGQDFTKKVANPRDIVQFYKKKTIGGRKTKVAIDVPEGLDPSQFEGELPERIEKIKVETLVRQYLEAQTLQMLHANGIGHAVNAFVEKDDRHAIDAFITRTLEQQRKEIERSEISQQAQPNDTDDEIEHGMQHVKSRLAQQFEEKHSKKGKGKGKQRQDASEEDEEEGEDQQAEDDGSDFDRMSLDDALPAPARGNKGKSTARGGAAKGKSKSLFNEASDEEDEEEEAPARKKAPAKKATTSTKASTSRVSSTAKRGAAAAKTQSQLNFAPARSSTGRAAARASTARSRATARDEAGSDSDGESQRPSRGMTIDIDDSDEDSEPVKRRTTKRR